MKASGLPLEGKVAEGRMRWIFEIDMFRVKTG